MCSNKRAKKKREREHDLLQNKSQRMISKQGVFRKNKKNIPHTCTSRSSCMTSFFFDPFLWLNKIMWHT
jgi:hypothetical protein